MYLSRLRTSTTNVIFFATPNSFDNNIDRSLN